MKKVWVWIMAATLVMAAGAFGSVFGEWKTVTMASEEIGIWMEYSVPASSIGEMDEEFEDEIGGLFQLWYVGDEYEPDFGVVSIAISGEWAELLMMSMEWELEEEDIEVFEDTYIEIGGITSRMVYAYDEFEMIWQWITFVPEIKTEAGTFGLVMMVIVTEELLDHGYDIAMRIFNSVRF